jgi:hypothetical protein
MDEGGHGFGIKTSLAPTNLWLKITKDWLQDQKLIDY